MANMAAIEISGSVIAVVGLVSEIFKLYGSIIRGPIAHSSRCQTLLSRLLVERARFETTLQLFSMIPDAAPELKDALASLLSEMRDSLEKATRLMATTNPGSSKMTAMLKITTREDNLKELIQRVTGLNDQLQTIASIFTLRSNHQLLAGSQGSEPSSSQEPLLEEILNSLSGLTGESTESVSQRLKAIKTLPSRDSFQARREISVGQGYSTPWRQLRLAPEVLR
jgi:hypothetical protein